MKSEDRLEAFRKIHKLYPRFLHIDSFGVKVLLVYDPEITKKLFTSVYAMERPFGSFAPIEKGLLFASYSEWREPRKHLNLAFNLNVLKSFIPIFSHYSQLTVKEMEKHLDGKEFDLFFFIAFLTMRTVSATILNVHQSDMELFKKVTDNINTMSETLFERMINPFYHYDFIYKFTTSHQRWTNAVDFLMQFGNNLIDESRQRHKTSITKTSMDSENGETETKPEINFIIDQLINHEEKYSDREIRDQLMTLQITASDTTMNLVSACFMYLAINQEIQQKVYDEIADVTAEDDDLDYEKLSRLKYLEKCLKESLRLFSPVPMTTRQTFEDCDLGTGKTVRKGTKIFFLSYIQNQRKDIWGENCGKFDPENFSSEKSAQRDPYSFAPFGSGARGCIGNRYTMIASKIFVAEIIKAYKFTTKLKESDMKMRTNITGKLVTEYSVSIEKRA